MESYQDKIFLSGVLYPICEQISEETAQKLLESGALSDLLDEVERSAKRESALTNRAKAVSYDLQNALKEENHLEVVLKQARERLTQSIVSRRQEAAEEIKLEAKKAKEAARRVKEEAWQEFLEEKQRDEANDALKEEAERERRRKEKEAIEEEEMRKHKKKQEEIKRHEEALLEQEKIEERERDDRLAALKVSKEKKKRELKNMQVRRRGTSSESVASTMDGRSNMSSSRTSLSKDSAGGPRVVPKRRHKKGHSDDDYSAMTTDSGLSMGSYDLTDDLIFSSIFHEQSLGTLTRIEVFYSPFLAAVRCQTANCPVDDKRCLCTHEEALMWALFQLYGKKGEKHALLINSLNVYLVFNILRDATLIADERASSYYVKDYALMRVPPKAVLWTKGKLDIWLRRRKQPGGESYGNALSFPEFMLIMQGVIEELCKFNNGVMVGFDTHYVHKVLRRLCDVHVNAGFLLDPGQGVSALGVCRCGILCEDIGSAGEGATWELWLQNMEQIRYIYTYYASTPERRRRGKGRNSLMMSLDELRLMLSDFNVLPEYIEFPTLLNMYQDVKRWEWRIGRSANIDADTGVLDSSDGMLSPRSADNSFSHSRHALASSTGTFTGDGAYASPIKFPYAIPLVGSDGNILKSSIVKPPKSSPVKVTYRGKNKEKSPAYITGLDVSVDEEQVPRILVSSLGHMSLSFIGFLEILSRIACYASLGPTTRTAVEGILQVMDGSDGKMGIVRSFRYPTVKLRDFVYD